MSGVSESTPPPAMPALAALDQTQTQSPPTAYSADVSVNAAVVFGAINSSPPTQVSIPPNTIILRHIRNTGSTWMKRKRGQPKYVGLFTPVMPQGQGQSQGQGHPQCRPQAVPLPPLVHLELQPPLVDLASPPAKKVRSRPPSTSKKQKMEVLGNLGMED